MGVLSWFDDKLNGEQLVDFGSIYDQNGLKWGLRMELRQREGQSPNLHIRWTYGSQIVGLWLDATPKILENRAI